MKKRLINYFADWTDNGIFAHLASVATVPWTVDPIILDSEYLGNRSGGKLPAPLIKRMTEDAETLTNDNIDTLAKIIWARFGKQWEKLYNVFSLEYNPIENYRMTETENASGTNGGTVKNTGSNSGTKSASGTNTGTVQTSESDIIERSRDTTSEDESSQQNNIFGYDNNVASPSGSQSGSASNTGHEEESTTESRSGTRTDNLANNLSEETSEEREDTRTDDFKHEEQRELTRLGNIGVTTSQQMIQSEVELWQYDFFEIVYKNIDSILTLPIY